MRIGPAGVGIRVQGAAKHDGELTMSDLSGPQVRKQERTMESVAADELPAIGGGTEHGDGGCATMWPRDPWTGQPVRPHTDWEYSLTPFRLPT
jgi:hypothetical protein